MSGKTIVKCILSPLCLQSYPCQHSATIKYSDGTEEVVHLDGYDAISNQYWKYLSSGDQEHFTYLKGLILSNPETYSDFLNDMSK